MIINAENLILGRMATTVAKKAISGEEVIVINCEKAIVKSPQFTTKRYLERTHIGQPQQGPFVYRRPDMFVKRVIRGMIPYKKGKGKQAFERIKCYIGVPESLAKEKVEVPESAKPKSETKSMTVAQLCRSIGAK